MRSALKGCCFGGRIHAFQRTGSTMEAAHDLAREGAGEGTLVWAAHQEQGRGRLGRTWESPQGGAYFSLILKPMRPAAEVPQLSLVAGLAAAEAIKALTGLFPSVRWPNDVLISDKKVCGILTEAKNGAVIVGIGINVTTHQSALPGTATSLAAAGATDCDPYRVTAEVCRHFDRWYGAWTARGFAPIREALRPWVAMFGHPVQISAGRRQMEGTAQDLDESGRLVVRLDSGILRPFEMGEVTLLG